MMALTSTFAGLSAESDLSTLVLTDFVVSGQVS